MTVESRMQPRAIAALRILILALSTALQACDSRVVSPDDAPDEWSSVSAGAYHTCALDMTGRAYCWGSNSHGQIGAGAEIEVATTPRAVETSFRFAALSAGSAHTCGVALSGGLICWGSGSFGQLGAGAATERQLPAQVPGLPDMAAVSAGDAHTCGVSREGELFCWGGNTRGQLGVADTIPRFSPERVVSGSPYAQVSAGFEHTCAVAISGVAYCWGANDEAQVGNASLTDAWTPALVTNFQPYIRVWAGLRNSCAMSMAGRLFCWGTNEKNEIGPAAPQNVGNPLEMLNSRAVLDAAIGSGGHLCAVDASGGLACWGQSADGRLGVESTGSSGTPVKPIFPDPVLSVTLGLRHSCALTLKRQIFCWGYGASGQLGDGTLVGRAEPRPVAH